MNGGNCSAGEQMALELKNVFGFDANEENVFDCLPIMVDLLIPVVVV